MTRKFFIGMVSAMLMMVACDKEQYQVIPYVPVYMTIDLNITNELMVTGNSVYFRGAGYAGVIVYCEYPGSWYAFDAACTHEKDPQLPVVVDGPLATCSRCGSQYMLMGGGQPLKGPATQGLQPYHVSSAGNILRIYN